MDPAVAGTPASAPPAAFEDGLGERRHTVGAGNEPLEVLRLSTELSAVSSFEFALRERASRFGNFRHESYGRVRAVERLDKLASTLVVVSDYIRGVRLSEMLATAHKRSLPLDVDAVFCLIRQLVSAVAALHERVPDVCHGAIGPERIIITPDGRLVIVEYVLGAALEQLRYSQERYWKELHIALPRTVGLPRFDGVTDVTQVGTVALALILGRPLGAHEYPAHIVELAGHAQGKSTTGVLEPLPAAIRMWLLRALQLDPRGSFASPNDAQADLETALDNHDSAAELLALKSFLVRYSSLDVAGSRPVKTIEAAAPASVVPPTIAAPPRPVATLEPVAPVDMIRPHVEVATSSSVTPPVSVHPPSDLKAEAPKPVAETPRSQGQMSTPTAYERSAHTLEDDHAIPRRSASRDAEVPMPKRTGWPRYWIVAAAVALIAVTSGVTMLGRVYLFPSATTEATGTLMVGTNPEGVAVIVDGLHRGSTPLSVGGLTPGDHMLELVTESEHRRLPVKITAGGQVSQFLELPKTAPALGDLQVRTEPPKAKVTVDGHLFGRSPLIVKNLTPGSHTVTLESDAASFTEEVTIEAGQTAALLVPMTKPQAANVSGWIAIAAPTDVQVYENQRLLGSSRSDRIMVSVGRHELEILNEGLGYRATRTVEVEPGKVAAVKLEWPKGTMALNASPWAEVWVDGERVGETPIGSVSVPIGAHEVAFRHPELGERRSNITVVAGTPTKVSVDMRAK